MGALLERAGLSKLPPVAARPAADPAPKAAAVPAPAAPKLRARHGPGDQAALDAAYRGVTPLRRRRGGAAAASTPQVAVLPADAAARARLDALVAEALRFEVRWYDDGMVEGLRAGTHPRSLARLSGAGLSPEATLDLHGLTRAEVGASVASFVRRAARRGLRMILLVVGKGLHSEDGHGVLAQAAVEALTRGGAAPRVAAFASSHGRHGGRGAIAVELRDPV